jgi:hypothetical protein
VEVFTARQRDLIADVLAESSDLLGGDAARLPLSAAHAAKLRVPDGTTYGQALALIAEGGTPVMARDFTGAVLALRRDPRVQGEELF